MVLVRWYLHRGVVAWLVGQLLTFTALVPRDCCALHGHTSSPGSGPAHAAPAAETEAPPCHEAAATPVPAAPTEPCAMTAEDGGACPMHRTPAAAPCAMTGVCHAPEAVLAAVLWQSAVPVAPAVIAVPAAVALATPSAAASPRALALPPDLPPPRS